MCAHVPRKGFVCEQKDPPLHLKLTPVTNPCKIGSLLSHSTQMPWGCTDLSRRVTLGTINPVPLRASPAPLLPPMAKRRAERGSPVKAANRKQQGTRYLKSNASTQRGPAFHRTLALENLQYAWLRRVILFRKQPRTVGLLQRCQRGL